MLGMFVGIMKRVDAIAPALVTERRVGHDVVEGLEGVTVLELGSARMFPCMMSAAGLLCRIMFIRAKPLVAASFSGAIAGDAGNGAAIGATAGNMRGGMKQRQANAASKQQAA